MLTRGVGDVSNEEEGDEELSRVRNSARYLLAVCCYEMGMYGEAEEALLRHVRVMFGKVVNNGGGSGKVKGNMNEVMDAWILQSEVSVDDDEMYVFVFCANLLCLRFEM